MNTIKLLLLSIILVSSSSAASELNEKNAMELVKALSASLGQEVNAAGRKRIKGILDSQGYSCPSISSSRSYPSENKTGFVILCENDAKYALYWRSGKPVIYRE